MAVAQHQAGRLWRYNYRILVGTGYWVLVLPIAASQVVTLWMMALAGSFDQREAARIAELMTPILGAFLTAHSLAPEYRSGIGAVLACKPVSLNRVVSMRVGLAMLAALLLTLVTLLVCSTLSAISLWEPLLASLPSLWFLSLLALTFATLFRSALAGFAVAAGLWALDFAVGYHVHPFLSLQGLFALLDTDALAPLWLYSKVTLAAAGIVLLLVHGRLLRRINQAAERKDVLKRTGLIAAILLLYCASGAACTIAYAYTYRGRLVLQDVTWIRARLNAYGPVPVARLFGPAFTAYVSDPPTRSGGESQAEMRVRTLEQALARYPRSIWADSIAYTLGMQREQLNPAASIPDFFAVADRFGSSPFAPKALARVFESESPDVEDEARLRAARRLVQEYPRHPETEDAARFLRSQYPGQVRAPELVDACLKAAEAGSRFTRPEWLLVAAEVQADSGDVTNARANAGKARELGLLLRAELATRQGNRAEQVRLVDIDAVIRSADALLRSLSGGA